jgi:hypothetical protein
MEDLVLHGVVRKTDKKARLTLFGDFADQPVIVERLSDDEVRVKRARGSAALFAGAARRRHNGGESAR